MIDLVSLEKVLSEWKPPNLHSNAENCESPRKIEVPPNCYEGGKIKAHCGEFTYEQIYKYTSTPLEIKNDGGCRLNCTLRQPLKKCPTYREYQTGQITKQLKDLVCKDCWKGGGLRYLDWCNTNALEIRQNLYYKGLNTFIDCLNLGFDPEKQALIFALNKNQYVELGFDGKEFTQPKKESLKILMHYNRELKFDGKGGFRPLDNSGCSVPVMPYLDNRFFGVEGEIIYAGHIAAKDNGALESACGKLILPFPL